MAGVDARRVAPPVRGRRTGGSPASGRLDPSHPALLPANVLKLNHAQSLAGGDRGHAWLDVYLVPRGRFVCFVWPEFRAIEQALSENQTNTVRDFERAFLFLDVMFKVWPGNHSGRDLVSHVAFANRRAAGVVSGMWPITGVRQPGKQTKKQRVPPGLTRANEQKTTLDPWYGHSAARARLFQGVQAPASMTGASPRPLPHLRLIQEGLARTARRGSSKGDRHRHPWRSGQW